VKSSAFRVSLSVAVLVLSARAMSGQSAREFSLGVRNGAIAEEFSDAVGMIELRDGRAVVTDRRETAAWIVDFRTGERKRLGSNGAGPNEYMVPFGPFPWRGDTSLIYDGSGRRVIRVAPNGTLAGTIPLPTPRGDGVRSYGVLRGFDTLGRVYWDAPIIQVQPTIKRLMKAQIVRWTPGTDSAQVVHEFTDHAEFEDRFRFSPMRQTDAWVVASDGRIGVLSAAEYRLRWYRDGKLVETGPAIPYTPVPVTAAEREAFWEKKAQEPASGVSVNGGPVATRSMSLDRVKTSWPDSIFPKVMPPFELNGAQMRPNGTIWVTRTQPAREKSGRIDILDTHGALTAILRLPPKARLFGIGAESVYLLATDDDGLQTLERYALPPELKR
jgi:hypothetical protein